MRMFPGGIVACLLLAGARMFLLLACGLPALAYATCLPAAYSAVQSYGLVVIRMAPFYAKSGNKRYSWWVGIACGVIRCRFSPLWLARGLLY